MTQSFKLLVSSIVLGLGITGSSYATSVTINNTTGYTIALVYRIKGSPNSVTVITPSINANSSSSITIPGDAGYYKYWVKRPDSNQAPYSNSEVTLSNGQRLTIGKTQTGIYFTIS